MHKVFIVAVATVLFSQTALAKIGNAFESFVPAGFVLQEQQCQWDFNQDNKADCVLIIKDTQKSAWQVNENNPNEMLDRNRRGLIILLKDNVGYKKVLENRAIFASENENGGIYFAPELSIDGKGNKLILHYGHGRYGHWQYVFDYRTVHHKKDFYLIGYDASSNRGGANVDSTFSINFLTHKIRYQKNINNDLADDTPKFETTWHEFAKQPLIKLSDITDIDELDMKNVNTVLLELAK